MPECVFLDKSKRPKPADLTKALGVCAAPWDDLIAHVAENYAPVSEEWKFMKSGWTLLLKKKVRTVCYLFPAAGYFTAAFVYGEKAVAAARQSKLPKRILDVMEQARPYAEGRGFYVECKKPGDLRHLMMLVALKMDTKRD
jgi:hypothetical protein